MLYFVVTSSQPDKFPATVIEFEHCYRFFLFYEFLVALVGQADWRLVYTMHISVSIVQKNACAHLLLDEICYTSYNI